MSEGRVYHELELAIARSPGHPQRILPTIPTDARRILDLGCGAGQSLIGLDLDAAILAVGIDLDVAALALGAEWTNDVQFVGGSGEALPFADETFDFVFSRVALPYMHLPTAIREIHRVLAPRGSVWLVLHGPGVALSQLAAAIRSLHVKSIVHQSYAITNGVLYHFTGRLLRWPAGGVHYESFQTRRTLRRIAQAGFSDSRAEVGPHFVVTARKL